MDRAVTHTERSEGVGRAHFSEILQCSQWPQLMEQAKPFENGFGFESG